MLTERQNQYLEDLRSKGSLMIASHHPRWVRRTFDALVTKGLATRQTVSIGWVRYVPTLDALERDALSQK